MQNFLLLVCLFITAQNFSINKNIKQDSTKYYYYKDKIVSKEKIYNANKKLIRVKTFYKTGVLNEDFYLKKGRYNGKSYRYNSKGKKITTWVFKQGKLVNRKDHSITYNKKNEESIKKRYNTLKKINKAALEHPRSLKLLYSRAKTRHYLGNDVLALSDLKKVLVILKNDKNKSLKNHKKILSNTYDILGSIYALNEMYTQASHYKFKAVEADTENTRLKYNLATYLYNRVDKKLALYYLEKVLKKWPTHSFSNYVLAQHYLDNANYNQAKIHIDNVFLKETNMVKLSQEEISSFLRVTRGYINHKLNNSNLGIKDLEDAIKLNRNNSLAYKTLGQIYLDLEQFENACTKFNKAKKLGYKAIYDNNSLKRLIQHACIRKVKQEVQHTTKTQKPYIYPNPVKTTVTVKNINFTSYKYTIHNFESRLVRQGLTQNNHVDFSNLPTGMYILTIKNTTNTHTFKVIKE